MFRTSIVHLQERSYAVCCDLICLDTSCCYEGEGRTAHKSWQLNHLWEEVMCAVSNSTYRMTHISILLSNSEHCHLIHLAITLYTFNLIFTKHNNAVLYFLQPPSLPSMLVKL